MSSKTIDENVVQMKFDNAQFESNVKTTMSTLDKLKSALNFSNAGSGLENLSKSCNNLASGGMGAVGSAVETVHAKFSALEVIGMTVLSNLTNRAIDAGSKIVSAMTIDGAKDGFTEYELKMNSTRTIMASTGADLGTVNAKLEELNKYADQTIYSFSDMTRNIGKFTNAGVGLDEAVNAIKGVSNVAAISGANADEASRAMYNFAQALSAGHVKLIDWKSIENANMATKEFKEQLLKTAVAMGTLKDAGDGTYDIVNVVSASAPTWTSSTAMFNESLAQQWMTTDVLVKTLNDYADANTEIGKKAYEAAMEVTTFTKMMDALKEAIGSGWSQTFEILFGNLDEAKELWTGINNVLSGVIQNSADARNLTLKVWKNSDHGIDKIKDSIKSIYESATQVTTIISDAFKKVLPQVNLRNALNGISDGFVKLAEALKPSEKALESMKIIFEGAFSVISLGIKGIRVATAVIKNFVSVVVNSFGGNATNTLIQKGEELSKFFIELNKGFKNLQITNLINKINEKVNSFGSVLTSFVGVVKSVASKLKDLFQGLVPEEGLFSRAKTTLSDFANSVKQNLSIISTAFNSDRIGTIMENFASSLTNVFKTLKTALSALMDAFDPVIEKIKSLFDGMTIGGGITKMINAGGIAMFVGIFGNIIENLSDMFAQVKVITGGVVNTITGLLQGLGDALEAWEQEERLKAVRNLAVSVGILAASIVVLSTIEPEKAGTAIGYVAALLGELVGAMKVLDLLMNKKKPTDSLKGIKGFIQGFKNMASEIGNMAKLMITAKAIQSLAAALFVASLSLVVLSTIPSDKIKGSLIAMTAIMVELGVMATVMSAVTNKLGSAKTGPLIGMAFALVIAAGALKILSTIEWDNMWPALVAMTTVLGVMGGVMIALDKFTNYKANGAAQMIAMSVALVIASASLKILASIKWTSLVKALGAMTVVLGVMAGAIVVIDKFTNYKANGAAQMIAMSVALVVASASLKILASIKWTSLVKALGAMTVVLGVMAGAIVVINKFTKFPATGAASMIAMAAALVVASVSLKMLAAIPWPSLIKSVVAMGVVLAEMVAACSLLSNPMALAGAGALVVLSAGLIALGVALKIVGSMSIGEIVIAIVGMAAALVVFGVAGVALGAVAPALLAAAGAVALFGAGLLAAGAGIALFAVGIATLAQVSKESASAIVDVVKTLISGFLEMIPEIAEGLVLAMASLANAIVEHLPELIEAGIKIVDGLLEVISTLIPKIVEVGIELITTLANTLAENVGDLIDAGAKLITNLISGISDAIETYLPTIYDSFNTIFSTIFDGIVGVFESVFSTIGEAIGKILGSVVNGFLEGMADGLKSLGTGLSEFMTAAAPFFKQLSSIDPSVIEAAKTVAQVCLIFAEAELVNGISNFMSVFTGGSSLAKFGYELAEFGKSLDEFGRNTKDVNAAQVQRVANASKALTEFAAAIPNEGGLISKITGDNSLDRFAEVLIDFGYGLQEFDEAVSGLGDIKNIETATRAGEILVEFAHKIPNEGGLVSKITGDNSLEKFANELVPFASSLTNFANSVRGLTDSDVDSAVLASNIGIALADFANKIPNEGGLVSKITGDNSLSKFSTEMSLFAVSLMVFRNTISGLTDDDLTATKTSTDIGRELIRFAEDASKVKGVAKLVKDNTLSGLSQVLNPFADAIKSFIEKISGISEAKTDIDQAISLLTLFNDVSIQNAGKNSKNLTAFGAGIVELGAAIAKFLKYLRDQGISEIETYTKNFLQIFVEVSNDKKVDFERAGKELFEQFLVGGKSVNPEDTCRYFINVVVNKLQSTESINKFYGAGKNAVQGFANGMSENSSIATKAAEKVASDAIKAAQKKMDEHSPSRVFYQIGDYAVQGLANALNDGSSLAYNASENMAGSAIDGLKSTISRISDYIQNGLGDESLTITPVLDLSNINAGFRSINSMFSHDQAMSISANGVNGNSINGTTLNQILEALNAFNGFNVVMDTGATVGALAPTMNSALGQISYREARR